MLDEQGTQTFFDQIHTLWIGPEIDRRKAEARLPADFKIRACLIKLPVGKPPIVEFNDEIHWLVTVKASKPSTFDKGDPVYIQQVERIESVERLEIDGVPVAFVYIYVTPDGWKVIFDFSPNLPEDYAKPSEPNEWSIGKSIAESLNDELTKRVVGLHDALQQDIKAIGLWPAPSLLPYPLSAIADECRKGHLPAASQILIDHCTPEFLEALMATWDSVPAFADRKQLFLEAFNAHRDGKYTLSVSALIPHIEGVITDWIITALPTGSVKWRQDSKTSQFRDVLTNGVNHTFVNRRIIEAALSFILDGPVLADFTNWLQQIGDEFPNRHVVGHGKFDKRLYTQENSIKSFLMLDTLHHVMDEHGK